MTRPLRALQTILAMVATLAAVVIGVACDGSGELETLCVPDENVFCRCVGGSAGTKQCRPDGHGFEQCYADSGPCQQAQGLAEEEGSKDGKALLEACEQSSECKSDLCRMGYCTQPCGNYEECTDADAGIYGDCVTVDGSVQYCVPYCGSQAECDEEYGAPSICGYTLAADAVPVVVCADFAEISLPPDGSPCDDDFHCHLGHAEMQRVCELGVCIGGCHEDDDCAEGTTCVPGAPGSCQLNPE